MTSKAASEGAPERVGDGDMTWATFGYLGAIVLGPVIPLLVYALPGMVTKSISSSTRPRSSGSRSA